jgi:protein involved in polysaccharide export with SLBB domain
MIRKTGLLFIIVLMLAGVCLPAAAQMTDDAVIEYIKDGMASGKSQNDLLKELMASGVTMEQAQRIKRMVESENLGMDGIKVRSGEMERRRRQVPGAAQSPAFEIKDREYDELTEKDFTLKEFTVKEGREKERDQGKVIFGHSIFSNRKLSFAPSINLPTPLNYRLGAGDEIIIDVWGSNEASIRQTISPDGFINIPNLGLVTLNGMTVKEAEQYLRKKLSQIYPVDGEDAASDFKLTLGNIRTIQVNVTGEVNVPGTYSISSLSNIYNALYCAGGINELGSLRKVQLVRGGKQKAEVDLYDFILNGVIPEGLTLEDGDVVNVPLYMNLVNIEGSVKRPMYYELKDGETLHDLLGYAGGFTGDAYRSNINVVRQNGVEYQVYTVDSPLFSAFILKDGDALTVGALIDRYENKLEIKGAVYRPGIYQLGDGIRTVSELIAKADGLMGDAFTNRALIHREREDLTLEVMPVDVKAVLSGQAPDVELKRNDILYIPSIYDLNDIGTITIEGEVASPGTFVYEANMTVEDIIMQAGGLLESASTVRIDVNRRIKNSASTQQPDSIAHVFTRSFRDGYVISDALDFVLQPYDYVNVRRSPGYTAQGKVKVSGEVMFPGDYVLTHKNERLSDVIKRAGGLNNWAYVKGARLIRHTLAEERNRTRSGLAMLTTGKDSVNVANLDLDESYSVGIDLEAALAAPGSEADLVLRQDDMILIPEYINTVKISGNVMYPNVVAYDPDMSVQDYVAMAGGYGYRSKKSKAYIVYMNGTIARARQMSKGVVEPGCEIVIPQKRNKEFDVSSLMSVATTSSSVATMLATIMNLIMK